MGKLCVHVDMCCLPHISTHSVTYSVEIKQISRVVKGISPSLLLSLALSPTKPPLPLNAVFGWTPGRQGAFLAPRWKCCVSQGGNLHFLSWWCGFSLQKSWLHGSVENTVFICSVAQRVRSGGKRAAGSEVKRQEMKVSRCSPVQTRISYWFSKTKSSPYSKPLTFWEHSKLKKNFSWS